MSTNGQFWAANLAILLQFLFLQYAWSELEVLVFSKEVVLQSKK